jgi:hypothetical protein
VPRPLQGLVWANGSSLFFLSHFFTMMLLYPPQHAGESICVVFEACVHAPEAALAPHDHVGFMHFV